MSDFQIEYGMLVKYTGKGGDVVIPSGVTNIGYNAFYGCTSLTSVIITNGVTSIKNEAFRDCKCLSSIVLPDNVTEIGKNAFGDSLPDGLKTDMRNLAPHLTDEALAVYFLKPEVWNEQEKGAIRETLRKEVISLFAFVSRQNDWFAEKSFYDIIIFR